MVRVTKVHSWRSLCGVYLRHFESRSRRAATSSGAIQPGYKQTHRDLAYLLMADDPMRDVRLFQVCDLFLDQLNRQSTNGIFQMGELRCPDNRRSNRFLLQQPSQRDMNAWNSTLFCD